MDADAPIEDPSEDNFGYNVFAQQLAPNLILQTKQNSLIAGVEAAWGSGKTSFLNLTKTAIAKLDQNVLILPYCPWLYSTVDALLLGFCVQLAAELEHRNSKLFGRLSSAMLGLSKALHTPNVLPEEYGAVAAAASLALGAGAQLASARQNLEDINLTNARKKVQDAMISKVSRICWRMIRDRLKAHYHSIRHSMEKNT